MNFSLHKLHQNKIALYPILTGILFLINELRFNFRDYSAREIILLTLIILSFCLLSIYITKYLVKSSTKASLIATLFIVINIFYADIANAILSVPVFRSIVPQSLMSNFELFLIPFLTIIWILFTIFIIKSKRGFTTVNIYLNMLALIFVFIEIFKWVFLIYPQPGLADNSDLLSKPTIEKYGKPDIYYIILDSYTSSESLKKYWHYDNSNFEDSLKNNGFYITHFSKVDYTSTQFCLASYLNASLLSFDKKNKNYEHHLNSLIKNNRIISFLSSKGYSAINYSLFDLLDKKKYYNFSTYNHFLGRTMWYVNALKLIHVCFPSTDISHTNLNIFKHLQTNDTARDNKPVFVYAHLMMPHIPFYFDENGNKQSKEDYKLPAKERFLKQLIYTNKLTLITIKKILANSKSNPIIIIQGDHGFRSIDNVSKQDSLHEAHTIFNAYYLPSGGATMLNDSIKPANTFRLILDYYFGMQMPMLSNQITEK
jgi:hypothetical protein